MFRTALLCSGLVLAGAFTLSVPASALTMKECSVKWDAAKSAGTTGGLSWNDFRKAQCGSDAAPAAPTSTTMAPAPAPSTTTTNTMAPAPAPTTSTGNVVFPRAVSAQYSNLSAGIARRKTCGDQYRANKANGGNGNLKWIMKGGGYYSECNKHLKTM